MHRPLDNKWNSRREKGLPSRHEALLLRCLGGDGAGADPGDFGEDDWGLLRESVSRHLVAPQLFLDLKRCAPPGMIPDRVMAELKSAYYLNTRCNIRLFHELAGVLRILNENHIPVILLKGAHLAEIVYDAIGARTMVDIDLLFKEEDLAAARKIVSAPGDQPLPVDYHTRIDHNYEKLDIDMAGVWRRAETVAFSGEKALVLSPEDLLLHMVIHLSHHHLFHGAGIRTIVDIRRILAFYGRRLRWDVVQKRAREWGVTNALFLTLSLAGELMGVSTPPHVMNALRPDDFDPEIKTWAMERIFENATDAPDLSSRFLTLWEPAPPRVKARRLYRLLIPEREFLSQGAPCHQGAFRGCWSYFIRFKRHFPRYVDVLKRLLARDPEVASHIRRENRSLDMRKWMSAR